MDRPAVEALLFDAVDELNRQLRADQRLERSPDTPLTGDRGRLDSLGMLNLLVLVEQRIRAASGVDLLIADDQALAMEPSPFRTLGTLTDHVTEALARALAR